MKIPGRRRLRRLIQRCRFNSGGVILMYHRVAEASADPWALCVSPRHFGEHLEVLRKHGSVVPLRQMAQDFENGKLPRRAVAVTFDDGYADNLHNAKPLLKRYDVPATVFVTTGSIGREHEFWWDELERIFLQPGTLPRALRLTINSETCEWALGEATHYSEEACRQFRFWRAWEEAPSVRHALYSSLWQRLHQLPAGEQQKVVAELAAWADGMSARRPTHRSLSHEEIRTLEQGELIEIGAHTVTHPFLPAHPAEVQRAEIERSKAHLEEILGRSVTSFAYPFGAYTAETVNLVREAGFTCACSVDDNIIQRQADPFQLPRVEVQDWNGDGFARRLSRGFAP